MGFEETTVLVTGGAGYIGSHLVFVDAARSGEVRHTPADLTKIRERLRYTVRVSLAEGLRRTVAWLRREREAVAGGRSSS